MPTLEQLARLDDVIARLKTEPKLHRQDFWVWFEGKEPPTVTPELTCGSAFCIAGATVIRAGAVPTEWSPRYDWNNVDDDGQPLDGPIAWVMNDIITPDGRHTTVAKYARELLGLNDWQAEELFSAHNTMDKIELLRDRIAAGDTMIPGAYWTTWIDVEDVAD